jgi:hypothetical protein
VAFVALRLCLTAVALAHLVLVLLVPTGRNAFLDIDLRERLPYLTFWRPGDAFGFPAQGPARGFIRYAMYAQDGQVQEGVFPNPQVRPDLRYSRWAAAGNVVSGNEPALHDALLSYLLAHLSSSPLKVELYAGEWEPNGSLPAAGDGRANGRALADRARLWKLGTHDGLTQTWKPASSNGNK